MNVMINDISRDLNTDVKGVQTAITLFLLIMAVLMIPCSKLTDRWGRKRCFIGGLTLYGIGALLSAISPGLGVLILGNSVFEGVGTAFLIPPVYIPPPRWRSPRWNRVQRIRVVTDWEASAPQLGPLISLITSGISWRAAFLFQAAVVAPRIVVLARRVVDRSPPDPERPFDAVAALSAVRHVLRRPRNPAGRHQTLALIVFLARAALLAGFFLYIRDASAAARSLCCQRTCSATGSQSGPRDPEPPVAAAHGYVLRRVGVPCRPSSTYSAVKTGVIFTAATVGCWRPRSPPRARQAPCAEGRRSPPGSC
jgi:MFS family permease